MLDTIIVCNLCVIRQITNNNDIFANNSAVKLALDLVQFRIPMP